MAKAQHRKPAANPTPAKNRAKPQTNAVDFFHNVQLQSGLIFAFAFLLYANTLGHGFVLDDGIVITENMYTQAGIKGIGGIFSHDTFYGFFKEEGRETVVSGGRYRPMSLVFFALLYQIVGASPFLFHLFTVLAFALTCVILYRTLLLLLTPQNAAIPGAHMVAWLATVLFAAHPIHTEVVANIKGCDEILALLGSLAALYCALKAWDSGERKWALAAGALFFAACLSKENAVAYAVLIPLALWFFRAPFAPATEGKPSWLGVSGPVFIALAAFLVIRGSILPWGASFGGGAPMELLNNPFLKFDGNTWVNFAPAEKLATIFYTLWKYVQLLFVPHPLTHDYYPRHIGIMTFSNPLVLLSLAVYAGLAYWVVRHWKQRDVSVFGILAFLLPLGIVSNLVFPVGTNMNERFVYMPSVGFCLVIAWLLNKYLPQHRSLVLGVFSVVVLLFSLKTVLRNASWTSDERLFMTDVAVSDNSAKLQTSCADILLFKAKKEKIPEKQRTLCQEAITRLQKALEIYPNFKSAYILRGSAYALLNQYPESVADYRKALELAPADPQRKVMLAFTLREAGMYYGQQKNDLVNAAKYLNESWQLNPKDPETARLLGVSNMVQGKQAEAIQWYTKAEEVAPKDAGSLWELGLAYARLGDAAKAEALQRRALAIDPQIAQKAAAGVPLDR